ncbi:cell division/cell wall cluster transcriptional repressor MraZ [Jeotgalibaca sp. PTS2502]|jgi:MraZ protein|uniref:Transcriptional regulator MraZ n=1 Tax=Candidatus Jeotgalibaca merdavium TaxID=2838627 RepID=A0A9D2I1E3_9LACT|nr:division/cell wall cluster transcriptional repressor MraZ [Jeotgalibaca sp. PTS2502]APZ49102.1 cell division/cell wall cluster transcriptional repressor MraZ [Jeotgalibaca sp. PTS2502]HJA90971.1 division/cell wall cluster transcriptional repressor MraZ [Candidatus Jeotgalibaca merdavium]
MLIGEYKHNMDAKGRIIMPAKFREELGQSFILTRGLDGCLFGYPMEQWEILQEKLKQLPLAKKDARAFVRFFYSAATEAEIDKQGRINIPANLAEYAKIEKECRVVGVSDRIEIWSNTKWEDFADMAEDSFEDIAESMIDFGL